MAHMHTKFTSPPMHAKGLPRAKSSQPSQSRAAQSLGGFNIQDSLNIRTTHAIEPDACFEQGTVDQMQLVMVLDRIDNETPGS